VLSLAIPGSAPAAVLLAAMFIHGVRPGPLIMIEFPEFVYQVVAMVLLATTAMFVLGLCMVRPLVKVLAISREKLMPVVFVLCVIGSYAIQARLFDVGVMVIFGIIGYYMREMDYPIAPMVLGIILGDILDKNLIRSLIISEGDLRYFFESPISIFIAGVTLITFFSRTRWFLSLKADIVRTVKGSFFREGRKSG
jgi:putative tricarboxylic transport membrane protein